MAKRGSGAQKHPHGAVVTISDARRRELRELREIKGLTHRQMADLTGLTQATISNVETGRTRQPRREVLAKIVKVLQREKVEDGQPDYFDLLMAVSKDLDDNGLKFLIDAAVLAKQRK